MAARGAGRVARLRVRCWTSFATSGSGSADSQQERPTGRKGTRTGDFDALLKHRMIRMLVAYSPTLFYHDRGQARGVIAAASRELKKFLNRKFPDKRPFTVVMIPTTRDRLLQGLIDGEGDVAGGSSRLHPPA